MTDADGRSGHDGRAVRSARYAMAAVFCVHGAVSGSFATRVPWIQDHVSANPGQLGLALAFPALGASVGMPCAGWLSHRFGARPALSGLVSLCLLSLALPSLAPTLPTLCAALFVYGGTLGMTDVAMNAQGVQIENRMGRSIMSGLHGMWSGGALLGSLGGTLAAHLGADARLHHALAAVLFTLVGVTACRWSLDLTPDTEDEPPRFALPPRSALLIGAVGLCAMFAESASLDWSAVYLRSHLDTSAAVAAASTTGFTLTMAVTRLAGDAVVDRFGAVRTMRGGGVLATAGGVLVVTAPHPVPAMLGFALIGLGIAVSVPLAFAAAGRSEGNPTQAIAGVATIMYAAGLVAPSAIGAIAQTTSLVVSFGVVTVLAGGLFVGAGVMRPVTRTARITGEAPTKAT